MISNHLPAMDAVRVETQDLSTREVRELQTFLESRDGIKSVRREYSPGALPTGSETPVHVSAAHFCLVVAFASSAVTVAIDSLGARSVGKAVGDLVYQWLMANFQNKAAAEIVVSICEPDGHLNHTRRANR
jgi:hypothetical protein